MGITLPSAVVRADRVHHSILQQVAFSQHLNPSNGPAARLAFLRGAEAPPFEYAPLTQADELLRLLDAHEPPRDHPAGALVGSCFDGTRLMIRALRDRTADAFHAMSDAAGWYPDAAMLALEFDEPPLESQPLNVDARQIIAALVNGLRARGLTHWRVQEDTVMSARVLVDGAKHIVRVNPESRFRRRDLTRLVVHEIDVHAVRAHNGTVQPLRCFETGLPGSLATEEGLAMVAEERAGVNSPGVLPRQVDVAHAIHLARSVGFRELYEVLSRRHGAGMAWGVGLRIKRGLARPDLPGVYAKDSVYLRGRMQVTQWLAQGGELAHLYIGKVSTTHPVADWLDQGWVVPRPVPPTWTTPAGV